MLDTRAVPFRIVALAGAVAAAGAAVALAGRPRNTAPAPQEDAAGGGEQLHRLVHHDDLLALRSFFERVDVGSVADDLPVPRASSARAMETVLAGLPSDWGAPFAFVQAAIRHVPYGGSVRGAQGALEAGAGNAVDQALLLRSLLEARGVRTRLVRGRLSWEDAARLVVGTPAPAPPSPDDPWPRWLETAADHWWVQGEREGAWVDLDPSFPDSGVGVAVGRDGRPYEALPPELVATVSVELVRGDLVLAEASLTAPEMVGRSIGLSFAARSQQAVDLWQRLEDDLRQQAAWMVVAGRRLGLLAVAVPARADGVAARPRVPPHPPRPSAVRRLFLDPDAGPWMARLEVPGRTLQAGPFELADLDAMEVRVRVAAPQAPEHLVRAPWGGGARGRLSLVVAAGEVGDERLAAIARRMYAAVNRVASAEQAARVGMRPPIDYWSAADALAAAARAEWDTFTATVPEAVGWVVLRGIDGISARSSAARVVRPDLRLAAVRWRPPEESSEGTLELVMSDTVTVGQLAGTASVAALRAAYGLLQSAVFSQVLNRLTERAPETAFDVTLRAIGTSESLLLYRDAEALPETWPVSARAGGAEGLRAGYAVLAPADFGGGGAGWWDIGVADGETTGWVPGGQVALHGRVALGSLGRHDDLDALLASLPALHRALRWLAELPGSGPTSLTSVPVAACASAAVAADVMSASLPGDFPRPDVLALCGSD